MGLFDKKKYTDPNQTDKKEVSPTASGKGPIDKAKQSVMSFFGSKKAASLTANSSVPSYTSSPTPAPK